VWCWGYNDFGQCGTLGTRAFDRAVKHPGVTQAGHIEANKNFTCVLRNMQPSLQCWGDNNMGQLANAQLAFSAEPLAVQIPGEGDPVMFGLGWESACAVVPAGRVYCWGSNTRGQLGNGERSTTPVPTPQALLVDDGGTFAPMFGALGVLRSDGSHQCLRSNVLRFGTYLCWGSDDAGELGLGPLPAGTLVPAARPTTVVPNHTVMMANAQDSTCLLVAVPNEIPQVQCYGYEDEIGSGSILTGDAKPAPSPMPRPVKWDPAFL
jgi:alpha-tubulin suppressor-like RCC1 family protein